MDDIYLHISDIGFRSPGVSSTSTFRKVQEDSNSPAISSKTGAIILQGMHQAAEKSTTRSFSASLVNISSNSLPFAMCLTLVDDSPPVISIEDEGIMLPVGEIRDSETTSSSKWDEEEVEVEDLVEDSDTTSDCLDAYIALDRNLEEGLLGTEETSSSVSNANMHNDTVFILSLKRQAKTNLWWRKSSVRILG